MYQAICRLVVCGVECLKNHQNLLEFVSCFFSRKFLGDNMKDTKKGKGSRTRTVATKKKKAQKTFLMESIVGKKVDDEGKLLYMVKWLDYPSEQNTWEPVEQLIIDCPEHVKEFEAEQVNNDKPNSSGPAATRPVDPNVVTVSSSSASQVGFARGLEPGEIIGVGLNHNKDLQAVVRWRDTDLYDIIPAQEAHERCPQLLLNYYESIIEWMDVEASDDFASAEHGHHNLGSSHSSTQ